MTQYDLIQRGQETNVHRGKTAWRHTGRRLPRDWSDAGAHQGTPRIVSKYQKLEETRKDPALGPLERADL